MFLSKVLKIVKFRSKVWQGVGTSTIRTSTGQKFQNVEMVFLVDQNVEIRTSKMSFEVDHYYDDQNVQNRLST